MASKQRGLQPVCRGAWCLAAVQRICRFCHVQLGVVAAAVVCLVLTAGVSAGAEPGITEDEAVASPDLMKLSLEELLSVTIITVSGASRYEQMASEAPARVSVIDAETIRRFGYRSLADALQGETGINITNDRNYQYVGYRGLSRPGDFNTRVLVMIDGVRLNDEVYHQAPIGRDFPLDLDLVKRIEIIRGPSNALYGNNAFFLTINVITVSARDSGAVAAASIDSRLMKTVRVTGEVSPKDSGWRTLFSGSLFHGPGSRLYFSAFDDPATNNGISSNCDYERGGSFFLKAEKGNLTLLGGFSDRTKGIPTGAWDTSFNDPATYTLDERVFADLSYQAGDTAADSFRLRSYYNSAATYGHYAVTPVDLTTSEKGSSAVWGGELVFTRQLSSANRLVAGIDFQYTLHSEIWSERVSTGEVTLDIHSPRQQSFGSFLQHEWRILPGLLFDLGGRYDYMSPSLNIFNPKAALIYKLSDSLIVKYLVGRSFRSSNAYERDYFDTPSNTVANPALRQESMLSHELLVEYFHGPGQRLSLTLFDYAIRDLISQHIDTAGQIMFQNHGRIRATGFEIEGDWHSDVWSGRLGYSFQQTKDQQNGQRLSNSPDSLVKGRLSREFLQRRLVLSSEGEYVSTLNTLTEAKGGDYALLHLTACARDLLVKDLDISVSVKNLLNHQYGQPGGAEHVETGHPSPLIPQDGRTIMVRLAYRFL